MTHRSSVAEWSQPLKLGHRRHRKRRKKEGGSASGEKSDPEVWHSYPSWPQARVGSYFGVYAGSMPPTSPTTWQLIGQLSTIGMSFVFALAIGFGGGYWLDTVLGTRPWLSFVGFFVGLAAGVLNVYRVMQLASRK